MSEHDSAACAAIESEIRGITKAIMWSSGALVLGGLVGVGLGIKLGRQYAALALEKTKIPLTPVENEGESS